MTNKADRLWSEFKVRFVKPNGFVFGKVFCGYGYSSLDEFIDFIEANEWLEVLSLVYAHGYIERNLIITSSHP